MRSPTRFVFSVMLSMLSFWACGSETSDSTGHPAAALTKIDVCGLLEKEDIREILGESPGEPQPENPPEGCRWPGGDRSRPPLVHLLVSRARYHSFQHFVTVYTQENGEEPGPGYHPVQGIGDWAMYVDDEHLLRAAAGERTLEVRLRSDQGEPQAMALAGKALARLR